MSLFMRKAWRQNFGYDGGFHRHRTTEKATSDTVQTVVRDLWTIRLSKLIYRTEDRTQVAAGESEQSQFDTSATETGLETGFETSIDDGDDGKPLKTSKTARDSPTLMETVALNYLGVMLLRRPIGLATIFKYAAVRVNSELFLELTTVIRWIQQEDIPYMRAIRHVPAEMKERLPGEYHAALDTTSVLRADELQAAVYNIAALYSTSFGMVIPPLNHTLLLLFYIHSLALPLEVYATARQLNAITHFPFTYPQPGTTRRQPTAYPESQLMALVVIATKLLFPFDSDRHKWHPKSLNRPGTLCMSWSTWMSSKRDFDNASKPATGLERGQEIHVKDTDILDMTVEQLDQYMDWYQRAWIKYEPANRSDIDQQILDMFPWKEAAETPRSLAQHQQQAAEEEQRIMARVEQVEMSLQMQRPITEDEEAELAAKVPRPGTRYQRFRTTADLETSEAAKMFHLEAAHTACMSVEALMRAVSYTEQMIVVWRRAKRRADFFGDEMDVEAERGKRANAMGMETPDIARHEHSEDEEDVDVDMMLSPPERGSI